MTTWYQRWTGWRSRKFGQRFWMSEVGDDGSNWRKKIFLGDDDLSFWRHGALMQFMAHITGGDHRQLKNPFVQTCVRGECMSARRGFAWESITKEGLMPQGWLWRRRIGGKLGPNRGPIGNNPEKLVSSFFWSVRHYLTFFSSNVVENRSRQTTKTKKIHYYVR